jgi:hypothetical protein
MKLETGSRAIMESARTPLPPLILYPFDQHPDPDELSQFACCDPLTKRYLEARYNEFRMLCLIGKDLNRWLGLCVEVVSGDPKLAGLSECDFIAVLLLAPPTALLQKMRSWGVRDFQRIFARAIGLNAVFPHPPSAGDVSESFLRDFDRYADALYDARLKAKDATEIQENVFTFEIYTSGEYSSYLEKTWESAPPAEVA